MADEELQEETAEQVEEQEEEQPEVKENKSKKLIIYGGVGLAQVVIAFVLVYFIIYPKYVQWTQTSAVEEEVEETKERQPLGLLHTISGLTVNPKDTRGNRFAIFEVVIEVEEEEAKLLLTQYEPVIIDRLLGYLRTKTVEELSFEHLTSDIKVDIMDLIKEILIDKEVENVYFTRFVLE